MDVKIEIDETGFVGSIEHLGIITEGDTFDELLRNLKEAIECYFEEEKNKDANTQLKFYFSVDKQYAS